MSLVKHRKVLKEELNSTSREDGQIVFAIDDTSGELYLDTEDKRIPIGSSGEGIKQGDNISLLNNDEGYITSSDLSDYATHSEIPTNITELNNDANYTTESEILDTLSTNVRTDTITSTGTSIGIWPESTDFTVGVTIEGNLSCFALEHNTNRGGEGKFIPIENIIQKNDNISELNNDVGYITEDSWVIEDLKDSVSSGKAEVASAITDKGVYTAEDATFEEMANNISQIETGGGSSLKNNTLAKINGTYTMGIVRTENDSTIYIYTIYSPWSYGEYGDVLRNAYVDISGSNYNIWANTVDSNMYYTRTIIDKTSGTVTNCDFNTASVQLKIQSKSLFPKIYSTLPIFNGNLGTYKTNGDCSTAINFS